MTDRRRFLACTVGASLCAAAGTPPALAARGSVVQMHIVDRTSGEVAAEHRHRGTTYVAGRPGERYAVRLSNRSGERVLVVLSVDGVNAVTGQTAATGQSGYVLAPWQTADITGWRKSDAEAAAFYFTALPDSYAARTDRPHNVGVIGVAVFREREREREREHLPTPRPTPFSQAPAAGQSTQGSDAARSGPEGDAGPGAARDSAGRAAAEAAAAGAVRPERAERTQRLGTGHGEREYAPISRTAFERASSQPAEIVQIRYDSPANLVAAGVLPPPRRWGAPEPFPGYVPDPR